jgi:hypothetical protein
LLDLFIGKDEHLSLRDQQRKLIISDFLNGDLSGHSVVHHCPPGHCPTRKRCLEFFQQEVTDALIPGNMPTFARHRWTGFEKAVDWAGLLAACGLFDQIFPVWVDCLRKHRKPVVADFETEDGDAIGFQTQSFCDTPAFGDMPEDLDWTAFNEVCRKDVITYASSSPLWRLVLMRVGMTPHVALMHRALQMADSGYDRGVHADIADGKPGRFRLLDLHKGVLTAPYFEACVARLFDESFWAVLPENRRTSESALQAFALISRAAAVTHLLMADRHKGFPYKLFQLIEDSSDETVDSLLQFPCTRDPFSNDYITAFGRDIGSEASRQTLAAIASVTKIDISLVECRHAKYRRLSTVKSVQTWCQTLADTSASFVCSQQRQSEIAPRVRRITSRGGAPKPPMLRSTIGRKQKKMGKAKPTHGGGSWRAFVSQRLKAGRRFGGQASLLMGTLAEEYRAIRAEGGDEWKQLCARGKTATRIHQLGGKSFGSTRCSRTLSRRSQSRLPYSKSLNEALARAGEMAKEKTQSLKRKLERQKSAIADWSSNAADLPNGGPAMANMSRGIGSVAVAGAASDLFRHCTWEVPAIAMASQVLPRMSCAERDELSRDWISHHDLIRQADADAIGQLCQNVGICYFAGRCLHIGEGIRLRHFNDALIALLKTLLRTGTRPRQLAEKACVIAVCFQSRDHSFWVHLAYVNYKTWFCVFLPLEVSDCETRVGLRCPMLVL